MTTFAKSLTTEIQRVARKSLKQEIAGLKSASAAQRKEIANLKKQVHTLTVELKKVMRTVKSSHRSASMQADPSGKRVPFGPAKLLATRLRFGLTQEQMAVLIETSDLSYFKWEKGKATPRNVNLVKIAAVMKLGKRAALARLQTLSEG